MELAERKYDLEERLIKFAGQVIFIVDKLPSGIAAKHLAGQLARSRTAPALNYAEAKGAESKRDFVHTMSTILKALRKTKVNLRIIHDQQYLQDTLVQNAGNECNELVLIIAKSIRTARANRPQLKLKSNNTTHTNHPQLKLKIEN
jgi:four helix bundle protein